MSDAQALATEAAASGPNGYPVRFDAEYHERLPRWLLFAKWLLAIPHFLARYLLSAATSIITFIAFFAILAIVALPLFFAGPGLSEAQNHYNGGTDLADKGQLRDAIAEFDRAIEMDPQLAVAYANRAVAYGKLKDDQHALSDASKAI